MLYDYYSSEAEQDTIHTPTTFGQHRSNICEKDFSITRTPLTNLDLNSSNVQNLRNTETKSILLLIVQHMTDPNLFLLNVNGLMEHPLKLEETYKQRRKRKSSVDRLMTIYQI